MSRSGYSDDCEDPLAAGRWRAAVKSAINGRRGQAFLRELAVAMDAMPVKELITEELVDDNGGCCTMGVVCKARGIDVTNYNPDEPEVVSSLIGIAPAMAQEIAYENDECGFVYNSGRPRDETPAERWTRMRNWVAKNLVEAGT